MSTGCEYKPCKYSKASGTCIDQGCAKHKPISWRQTVCPANNQVCKYGCGDASLCIFPKPHQHPIQDLYDRAKKIEPGYLEWPPKAGVREAIFRMPSVQHYDNDQSQKADGGKSDPVLVEVDLAHALEVMNRVLDYGKEKYGKRAGWQQVDMPRYDSAARRHRRDRDKGELRDRESNLLHMAHEATNLMFQLEMYIRAHPEEDFLTYNTPPKDHITNGSN
ncbi:hypothetical protein HW532_20945 [Kaustia mangrovi]|uniref:dATP/dGTP diphosphohydrolase N-terminal domain-containing protein n=1 Tax=Kaustia mangrovi TaxID=2593653 RepID=A0A7S8C7P1_9HYPH|nr:dATP/dGTP diphosphohydrolase domain-containing protein [Kaustia mangrovi]QPC44948.1 hypothetical protein HW532_20945 [Kaustia mangrovi]